MWDFFLSLGEKIIDRLVSLYNVEQEQAEISKNEVTNM